MTGGLPSIFAPGAQVAATGTAISRAAESDQSVGLVNPPRYSSASFDGTSSASRECCTKEKPARADLSTAHAQDSAASESHGILAAAREATFREADLREGARRLATAHAALRLVVEGHSQRAIAKRLCLREKTVSVWLAALRAKPDSTAEDFAPRRVFSGRRAAMRLTAPEVAAVRAHKLQTNLTATSGSTPEALRIAARRGELRDVVAETIAEREEAGARYLPQTALDQLRIAETTTRAYRAPRDTWLDTVTAPGSLHIDRDDETGEERLVQPGERWTIDDGSVNLLCIVPGLERPGDKCWDRWGVCVGRFQFLVVVDHRSRYVVGWSYTARPRDSYRAEDLVATLHTCVLEHGAPRSIVMEHGVSAARQITETLDAVGVEIIRAGTPHGKVVESVFHRLWLKLSVLPGQVGRFRGEEEEANKLLGRIRDGSVDPRGKLLALPEVLAALRDAIADHNQQVVNSERYGRWRPAAMWSGRAGESLRKVAPGDAWMFAPRVTEPLVVRGFRVETTVQLFTGYSVKFVFAADWLSEFAGHQVKLFFNPFAPDVQATAVLVGNVGEHRAGKVLGVLEQIDRHARFSRRALGYGADPDIGAKAQATHAQALRRHVAAVRPDGRPGVQTHEIRNGEGMVATASTAADAVPARQRSVRSSSHAMRPATPEEWDAQRARLDRLTAARKRLERINAGITEDPGE